MTSDCEACRKQSNNGDTLLLINIDGKKYIYCTGDVEAIFAQCEKLVKGIHFTDPAERAHYVQFDKRTFMLKTAQFKKLAAYIKTLRQ